MVKTALVTGVSRGLGLAIARRLLESGWFVFGVSRTVTPEWQTLAQTHAGQVEWRTCDLAQPGGLKDSLFSDWIPFRRPLHALVNNAALAYDDLVTNASIQKLEEMWAVNVTAPIILTLEVLRNMVFCNSDRLFLQISSICVHRGSKGLAMYAAGEGALDAFSRSTARECGERGIRSNCVVPRYMETEITAAISLEQRGKIHRRTSLRRATDVKSVAATAAFLFSDEARSITGKSYFVDCGYV